MAKFHGLIAQSSFADFQSAKPNLWNSSYSGLVYSSSEKRNCTQHSLSLSPDCSRYPLLFFFKTIKILRKAGMAIANKQKVSLLITLIYKKKAV